MPGIPGGTQLACGESCGGLAWNSLSIAAYFGVSEGCSGGGPPPPRRPPKLISQTPFISGNCAIVVQVPPGNLLASAPNPGTAADIRARHKIARTGLRMNIF